MNTLDRDVLCDTVTEAVREAESAPSGDAVAQLETLAARDGDVDCEGLIDVSADTDEDDDSIGDADSEFDALGLPEVSGEEDADVVSMPE